MIRHRGLGGALAVIAALVTGGCDEKLSTLAGPTPNLEPTFSSIQQFIFEANDAAGRAACTGCHTNVGRTPSAGMNLVGPSAHASLVGVPSNAKTGAVRVIPGDPENSYLVQKLEGHPGIVGQRMPRTGGPYLTEGQMLIIRRWIARGAPND
jgi:hypothetical protein